MRHSALFFAVLAAGCGGSTSAEGPVVADDTGLVADTSSVDDTGTTPIDDGSLDDGATTEETIAADAATDSSTPKGDSTTTTTACISAVTAGTTIIKCDGFAFDVTVPDACVAGGCGIVLDVHGLSMSGKMEDDNTAMRALGAKYGYVIVQPNANPAPPSSSWNPGTDDDKVFGFLKQAITAFAIDPKRVHMTGFSQGGMMTSRMLCKHADLWASVAPAAGTGCTFSGADTPSREVHTLYLHGTSDALVAFSVGKAQVDAAVAKWKMTAQPDVESDAKHVWRRWKSPTGTVLEFVQHDYQAASFVLKGHCFPGSKDLKGGEPGQLFPFGCTEAAPAFVWGEIAMAFFVAHPKAP
jgi:polyhydroxybutyrate depolymerase